MPFLGLILPEVFVRSAEVDLVCWLFACIPEACMYLVVPSVGLLVPFFCDWSRKVNVAFRFVSFGWISTGHEGKTALIGGFCRVQRYSCIATVADCSTQQ